MSIQRVRNLYDPKNKEPFRLSRGRLERFLECPRCFYLDRRLGIDRPSGPGFSLNIAVDALLKKEFDIHRGAGSTHPLMKKYGVDAIPFAHEKMDDWRDSLRKGVEYLHQRTNLMITGGVDDIWITPQKELIVVDYKATSTESPITLEGPYKQAYKRQMEIYQWLLRHNSFRVSDTGYFVYVNGKKDRAAFDGKLEFDVELIPYTGNDAWVEKAILGAHKCLKSSRIPASAPECKFCLYRAAVAGVEWSKS